MSLEDDDDLIDEEFLPETEISSENTEQKTEEDLLLKGLEQYGFKFPDGISGEAVAANIRQLAQRSQQMPDEIELAELREARSRYRQERETPEKPKEQPEQRQSLTKPSDAEQYVKFDEELGHYIPRDPRYPNIKAVEEMNAWRSATEKNKQRLFENPLEFLLESGLNDRLESIKKQAKEELAAELKQQENQRLAQQAQDQFYEKVGPELYETDNRGFVVLDYAGNPLMTQKGARFSKHYQEAFEAGINDPLKAAQYAYQKADSWSKRQRPKQESVETEDSESVETEQSPDELAEAQKQSFTKRARTADESSKRRKGDRVINRDASVVSAARNGDPQNSGQDFIEIARQVARETGVQL